MAKGYSGVYPHYLFKEHDPVLDSIDQLLIDAGMDLTEAALASGVARTTLVNWQMRKTRRPQFATIKAVTQAVGGELRIIYKGMAL